MPRLLFFIKGYSGLPCFRSFYHKGSGATMFVVIWAGARTGPRAHMFGPFVALFPFVGPIASLELLNNVYGLNARNSRVCVCV